MRSVIVTSSAAASIFAKPSRNKGIVTAREVRASQDVQDLQLGRGRFEKATAPINPANNDDR
jgi:hypothetical protein